MLAIDVGLMSASDARVLSLAIAQALPVLTRDAEDFTDLHDLIMTAGGHHPGVLIVRFDNDPRHNLTDRAIASAISKLESSGIPIADQTHVLNQWRRATPHYVPETRPRTSARCSDRSPRCVRNVCIAAPRLTRPDRPHGPVPSTLDALERPSRSRVWASPEFGNALISARAIGWPKYEFCNGSPPSPTRQVPLPDSAESYSFWQGAH